MKCLFKYKWVKLKREFLPPGKGLMGYWSKLASRVAFRKGNAFYCGHINEVNVGEWVGGVMGLKSIPAKFRYGAPCERKSFQALRIEVNGELDGLYELTLSLARRLKKGGRLVILTFQSLEDRIVKEAFKYLENPCRCPSSFPVCVCGKKPEIKIITKKPITASEAELEENSRSKCAKLRIAERI